MTKRMAAQKQKVVVLDRVVARESQGEEEKQT
jgi:hypothetical protein